eukprot:TRINITY_DN2427_c0_g1_i1.p1 TRINITY_DN2427_c0_g1~~TRINITY_DN2427_c0_g1_i1.p1  ORF type:complete len:368 (+),score=110.80 TRINITY_DN2427_c0_g1_i1:81-1184(+)
MPPKKDAPSKKTADKAKQKVIEDKTFGLKNKNKSKKVEQYIKSVQNQVQGNARPAPGAAAQLKAKEEKAKQEAEIKALFKATIIQPKVPFGVDPKSILCEFHKQGVCDKGSKCKFSHDLNQPKKVEKIDLYTDTRGASGAETMENWDQEKLESVVHEKHARENQNNPTEIVCKFFLEAVEKRLYGWFWECPNGGKKCQYRHALPPGYVLKSAAKAEADEDDEDKPSLEELLESERQHVVGRTPVTLETFQAWKEKKKVEKKVAIEEAEKKKQDAIRLGRHPMSGRDLFTFNPDLFIDDDGAATGEFYEVIEEEEGASAEPVSRPLHEDQGGSVQVDESLFTGDGEDLPDDEDEEEEDEGDVEEEDLE